MANTLTLIRERFSNFDESKHPRVPKGSEHGGEFAARKGYYNRTNESIEDVAKKWFSGDKLYDKQIHGNFPIKDVKKFIEYDRSDKEEYINKLSESIKSEGIKEPLVIEIGKNGNVKISEGNHRIIAAERAGLSEVPIQFQFSNSVEGGIDLKAEKTKEDVDRLLDLFYLKADDIYYIFEGRCVYDNLIERFAWEESKHPRGQPKNKGQFGPGHGGGTSNAGSAQKSARPVLAAMRRPPVHPRSEKALGTLKRIRNAGERISIDTGTNVRGGIIDKIGVRANGQVGVQLQGSDEWVFPVHFQSPSTGGWQSAEEKEEKESPAAQQEQINKLVSSDKLPNYADPDVSKLKENSKPANALKDFDQKFQFDESIDQECREAFTNAVNEIAKVNPDAFRNLKTKITSDPSFIQDESIRKQVAAAKGAYVAGHNTIFINPKAKEKEFVALHELGHLFEYTEIPGRKLEANGTPGSRNWDGDQTPKYLRAAINEIKSTKAYDNIKVAAQKAADDEPIQLANGATFNISPKYTDYISKNTELFARAFSQYIVHKTGKYEDQMQRFHKSDGLGSLQWSHDDFKRVSSIFDKFLNTGGVSDALKSNKITTHNLSAKREEKDIGWGSI